MRRLTGVCCWPGLLVVLTTACQGDSVDQAEVEIRSYREVLRIGTLEGEGATAFASIAALQLDPMGRIYVLDEQARQVRVFDASGAFVRSIGAAGRGPGELHTPIGLTWDPDGHLWVVDPGNARYSVFDTAGNHLADQRRKLGGYVVPWSGGFADDGRLWDTFNVYRPGHPEVIGLVGLNHELEPVDSLLIGPVEEHFYEARPGVRAHVPFTPYLAFAFDRAGAYWVGDAAEYEIRRISLAGDTLRAIQGSYEPVRVTAAERDSAWAGLAWYREMGGVVDRAAFPDEKPAFDAVIVDDTGRLWLHLRREGDMIGARGESVFDVVSPGGAILGRVHVQPRLEVSHPRPLLGERIVAVTRDALDVSYVVVLEAEPR